jgi:hypothetical protein
LGKIGVLAESAVRRSTRRKRVRGEKEFIVDSDTLLRDLKVKVSNPKSADVNRVGLNSSVRDPDPHFFGPPGSGSISQRYGSGSFPFTHKGVERTEILLAK